VLPLTHVALNLDHSYSQSPTQSCRSLHSLCFLTHLLKLLH